MYACGELRLSIVHFYVLCNQQSHCTGCCYVIERQQIVADIERLTSDKADLLTRLQRCEEDLKAANECENLW